VLLAIAGKIGQVAVTLGSEHGVHTRRFTSLLYTHSFNPAAKPIIPTDVMWYQKASAEALQSEISVLKSPQL
jgi:hypothetical protein